MATVYTPCAATGINGLKNNFYKKGRFRMANILFQNAIQKIEQNVPPIWFMRQAGRYHAHYQNLRSKNTFDQLCKIPELAAEVAMGPIQDFDFDVAILFSDILYPLEAMGFGLDYTDHGPQLGMHLNDSNIKNFSSFNSSWVEFMQFQNKAVKLTREMLPQNKSLIGFVGGPWTLFSYAVQGTHTGGLLEAKKHLHLYPEFMKALVPFLKENIKLQLAGGAEVVMIFDTASGEVAPSVYNRWLVPTLVELAQTFPNQLGYYSKSTQFNYLDEVKKAPWVGMGYDHHYSLKEVFKSSPQGFVQGNFDQSMLHMPTEHFKKELEIYLNEMKNIPITDRKGWVSGLGHGVLPKTPEAHVKYFVQRTREALA